MRTIFEYRYRDAGNFKASGSVTLEGSLTPQQEKAIRTKLQDGDFFIAEQIGVPPLYDQLYQWSSGPIDTDHCWHEFVGFRMEAEMEASDGKQCIGTTTEFVKRFASVVRWKEALSPHFELGIAKCLDSRDPNYR